jgi:hypothetical protein
MSPVKPPPEVLAVKDASAQQAIPTSWRPVLAEVVSALRQGDYGLKAGVPGVKSVSAVTEVHIRESIRAYGATLVELPKESWESSVCMWYGTHWDALVDLWTKEEGRSDLVLSARIEEATNGYSFQVHMVYVP